MASEHVVKSFDEELGRLQARISEMGGLAETQLASALEATVQRDTALAERVIQGDKQVDELERQISHLVIRLLALRQPMAVDLRAIVAALKIASALERVADYAKNIAKRSIILSHMPPAKAMGGIERLGRMVVAALKEVLDAYAQNDLRRAQAVWRRDEEVDDMYNSLFRELLTYMMEDPRNITACTHMLFMAKNIERIGDHATNIAEIVQFKVQGTAMAEERPKGESTYAPAAIQAGTPGGGKAGG